MLEVPAEAQVDFGVMIDGKLKVRGKATAGKVIVVDLPGAPKGAFGVFSVTLDGKKLDGKFKPEPCEDGAPAFGGVPLSAGAAPPE